ncbi:MAG: hypothetical protein EA394_11525 [Bacteroidia bacterium]|nr:MAG: hypothetical protein EA394_11525 [Bacteroidia bacterium]
MGSELFQTCSSLWFLVNHDPRGATTAPLFFCHKGKTTSSRKSMQIMQSRASISSIFFFIIKKSGKHIVPRL